jgi:hypothetical protein
LQYTRKKISYSCRVLSVNWLSCVLDGIKSLKKSGSYVRRCLSKYLIAELAILPHPLLPWMTRFCVVGWSWDRNQWLFRSFSSSYTKFCIEWTCLCSLYLHWPIRHLVTLQPAYTSTHLIPGEHCFNVVPAVYVFVSCSMLPHVTIVLWIWRLGSYQWHC